MWSSTLTSIQIKNIYKFLIFKLKYFVCFRVRDLYLFIYLFIFYDMSVQHSGSKHGSAFWVLWRKGWQTQKPGSQVAAVGILEVDTKAKQMFLIN